MIVIASENERQEQQRIEMTMVMADGDDKGRQLGVDGGGRWCGLSHKTHCLTTQPAPRPLFHSRFVST